jgi:NADH-quinone oxidoreductase subunit H
MLCWSLIPFDFNIVIADVNLGILFLFAFSSLGVYGIIMSGRSSNSKYSFLGALRSSAHLSVMKFQWVYC